MGGDNLAGITLKGVTKTYGSQSVLNNINLDIADGEFLTLVGPSGCGKSTTLRIIAGLETQSTGDVFIDGSTVNETRPSKRDLAMVFQSYALYPHLTVHQNLITPLKLRDLTALERVPLFGHLMPERSKKMSTISAEVQKVAEILKIEPLLDRKPGQLSGGQRQRVALGRAMVRNPAAFLMDEPLSNLDASLRVHMRAELSELHRELKATFIYVTHDQAEALTMSDRIAVMMDGDLLQLGPPDEVYENPTDIRVAEFIGSPKMNILPASCDAKGSVDCLGQKLKIALTNNKKQSLSIGIRPEHLVLQSGAKSSFSGKLTYKENLGSDVFLHLDMGLGNQKVVIRTDPQDANSAKIGEKISFGANPNKYLVFDNDGKRIDAKRKGKD